MEAFSHPPLPSPLAQDALKKYEATLQSTPHFAWTPKHSERFRTDLSRRTFFAIAQRTVATLGWSEGGYNESQLRAYREGGWSSHGEQIRVDFDAGAVTVRSESIQGYYDWGRNSKNAQLFVYAFHQIAEQYDATALAALDRDLERAENWEDYSEPKSFPKPVARGERMPWLLFVGGAVLAGLLGGLVAAIQIQFGYFLFAFEVAIGFALGFLLFHALAVPSRMAGYAHLLKVLLGVIVLTYAAREYWTYRLLLDTLTPADFPFTDYLALRWEKGFLFGDIETGWIGLLLIWGAQIWFTNLVAAGVLTSRLITHAVEDVPRELVEFALYQLHHGKNEPELRRELAQRGWTASTDQDAVLLAVEAVWAARGMAGQ